MSRPSSSYDASGNCSPFTKSLTVIRPPRWPVVVDQRKPLALVLAQQAGGLVAGDPDRAGDQRHRGHHLVDLGGRPLGDRGEAEVAVGDDAEEPVVGVDDGEPGDAVLAADAVEVLQRASGPIVTGLEMMPGLGALDEVDLVGLVLDREVAVEHAETALAGHRDGHPALGDGVHRGADQRRLEGDLAGQPGGGVDVARRQVGVSREEQDVVVGQPHRGELLGLDGLLRAPLPHPTGQRRPRREPHRGHPRLAAPPNTD